MHEYLLFNAPIETKEVNDFVLWTSTKLSQGMTQLTVSFNTVGGNVEQGVRMMNHLRSLPIELTFHNTGAVGSMGIPVFASAGRRLCAPDSSFTFHGSGSVSANRLDEQELRNRLEQVVIQNTIIAKAIHDASGIDQAVARELLVGEQSKSAEWALENGLCEAIEPFQIPIGAPLTTLF